MVERSNDEGRRPKRRSMPASLREAQADLTPRVLAEPLGVLEVSDAAQHASSERGKIMVRGRNIGSNYQF